MVATVRLQIALVWLCTIAASSTAHAFIPSAGEVRTGGLLGPAFLFGAPGRHSAAPLTLLGHGVYAIDSHVSAIASAGAAVAETSILRLRSGLRYQFNGLGRPLLPFLQTQLSLAEIFAPSSRHAFYFGLATGVGVDYFLTRRLGLIGLLQVDTGAAAGHAVTTLELLVGVTYQVF